MVSIPDWGKFARSIESPTKIANVESRLERIRQEKFYKEAEERGYLVTLSKSMLRENCIKNPKSETLRSIQMVRLVGVHLRDIGCIYTCKRLRICILHSNYINKFDALIACPELVKLDLHSNQISILPGVEFWENLSELRILHLHNNLIGRLEHLQSLAACQQLDALTLYDTPVSLKRAYRHHVVNSIWSLRALDKHVVSDEEIIEDATFGGMFSAISPHFYIDLMPPSRKKNTVKDEMQIVIHILSQISSIQARMSPVLIIQRFIRGYLARKRYHLIQDTRIWAAVSIQRYYRNYKGLPKPEPPPPPTSPTPGASVDESSTMRIDFDTYMQNRRPGSQTPSLASGPGERVPTTSRPSQRQSPIKEEALIQIKAESPTKASSPPISKIKTNLHINLTKLHTDTMQYLQDTHDLIAIETSTLTCQSLRSLLDEPNDLNRSPRGVDRRDRKKKKEFKTVKQMLGPLPELEQKCDYEYDYDDENSNEFRTAGFRLKGMKPLVHDTDPLQDMLISRREAARDIRAADQEFLFKRDAMPKPPIKKKKIPNADQRLFARAQGTMGMSSLRTVQQAYKDREHAEKIASKVDFVMNMRMNRDQAKGRIKGYLDEKRALVQQQHEREINRMAELMEKQEKKEKEDFEKRREMRSKTSEIKYGRRTDRLFISDFNSQHTSVSNALLRHDRQAKHEDVIQEKQDTVHGAKNSSKQQQDLVYNYLEHRKLMRQAHAAMERATLDTRLLQETNDRLMEARNRVTQQKQKQQTVQAFYPLPKSGSSTTIMQRSKSSPGTKTDRWNALVLAQDGRVGNHHTLAL